MPRALIFTSKTGGGHVSLAESLRDLLAGRFEIDIVDPQPRLVHWHYRLVSRHALWLWAAEFKSADTPGRSLQAHKVFTAVFARNLGGVLRQARPDLVLTTYPFLTYEVTQAMRAVGLTVPFVMLFTDAASVHHSWLTERSAASTFAPTRETQAQALAAGFDPLRLHLTGWPVRGQFHAQTAESAAALRARLGLRADRFTVFLQGGGEGAARFARTVETLLAVPDIQIILAAGTNQALMKRFADSERLRPIGFTKEIAPYMSAADVVVGKAGPNMLFESVTLGKPFVATTFIPGQEEGNLDFIRRHKLGWAALTGQEQAGLLAKLAAAPAELAAMRQDVQAYAAWNTSAVQAIPALTLKALERAGG